MTRRNKSRPFAVRLPHPLAEWVERYAQENQVTRSAVFEQALEELRRRDGRRLNGKKKTLLDTLKRAEHGA